MVKRDHWNDSAGDDAFTPLNFLNYPCSFHGQLVVAVQSSASAEGSSPQSG